MEPNKFLTRLIKAKKNRKHKLLAAKEETRHTAAGTQARREKQSNFYFV